MGGPTSSKRRSPSGNVAGRYLAAIAMGAACGEQDPDFVTLSPVATSCHPAGSDESASPPQYNSGRDAASKTRTGRPKTLVKQGAVNSSTTSQQQKQHYPSSHSLATAPTAPTLGDNSSFSWATTSSPGRSRAGTAHSPSRSLRTSPPNSKLTQQQQQQQKQQPGFFSIFPSTKIALRSSSSNNNNGSVASKPQHSKVKHSQIDHNRRQYGSNDQPPPPPPPPPPLQFKRTQATPNEGSSHLTTDVPNQPQHLLQQHQEEEQELHAPPAWKHANPQVERVLNNNNKDQAPLPPPKHHQTQGLQHHALQRHDAITAKQQQPPYKYRNDGRFSPISSDFMSEAGAPTEVMTNRTEDRRATSTPAMDPEDALWRKKKQHHGGQQQQQQLPSAGCTGYATSSTHGENNDEEKKQETDTEEDNSLGLDSRRGRANDPQASNQGDPNDLNLFAAIPLERVSTRRTSNRGNFNIQTTDHPDKYHFTSAKEEAFVRRKQIDDPVDIKSLLSESTNDESSSVLSPPDILLVKDKDGKKLASASVPFDEPTPNRTFVFAQDKDQKWWKLADHNRTGVTQSQIDQKKSIVAYPDSPPSYLKATRHAPKTASPANKHDVSFDSYNSDVGVIGSPNHRSGGDDGDIFKGMENSSATSPLKEATAPGTLNNSQQGKYPPHQGRPTKCLFDAGQSRQTAPFKLQPTRRSRSMGTLSQEEDAANESILTESSGWTPVAVSDAGIHFSASATPLQQLFSQDRCESFGENSGNGRPPRTTATTIATKTMTMITQYETNSSHSKNLPPSVESARKQVERDRTSTNFFDDIEPAPFSAKNHSSPSGEMGKGPGDTTKESSAIFGTVSEPRQGSRPLPSPEIWRRAEQDDGDSLDPIFCTQPSASVSQQLSQPPSYNEDSPLHTSSDAQNDNEAPLRFSDNRFSHPEQRNVHKLSRHLSSKFALSNDGVSGIEHIDSLETGQANEDEWNNASVEVETGREDKFTGELSSRPRRWKSYSGQNATPVDHANEVDKPVGRRSLKLSGAFQAAFAAFETSEAAVNTKPKVPLHDIRPSTGVQERNHSDREGRAEKAKKNTLGTSKLSLVLGAHLERTTDDAGERIFLDLQDCAPDMSVDVQSIRSAFESAGRALPGENEDEDDDDDTASVKSRCEVFEAAAQAQPVAETTVSKARAIFEKKRWQSERSFEAGNASVKQAFFKFEAKTVQSWRGPTKKSPEKSKSLPSSSSKSRDILSSSSGSSPPLSFDSAPTHESQKHGISAVHSTRNEAAGEERLPSLRDRIQLFSGRLNNPTIQKDTSKPGWRKDEEHSGKHTSTRDHVLFGKDDTKGENVTEPNKDSTLQTPEKVVKIPISIGQDTEWEVHGSTLPVAHATRISPTSTEKSISPEDHVAAKSSGTDSHFSEEKQSDSGDQIVSPPRLGISCFPASDCQDNIASILQGPNHEQNKHTTRGKTKIENLPKLKNDSDLSKQNTSCDGGRGTTSSDSEFSDGVTLDLSIADVSQLTNPTALVSKAEADDATLGDGSAAASTVVIDLTDSEAKQSEASSSQATESAIPLISRALKRLSDDMSLESRTQMARLCQKSTLLGPHKAGEQESSPQEEDVGLSDDGGWDLRNVEASFPRKTSTSDEFFRFGDEEKWESFDNSRGNWFDDPFPSTDNPTNRAPAFPSAAFGTQAAPDIAAKPFTASSEPQKSFASSADISSKPLVTRQTDRPHMDESKTHTPVQQVAPRVYLHTKIYSRTSGEAKSPGISSNVETSDLLYRGSPSAPLFKTLERPITPTAGPTTKTRPITPTFRPVTPINSRPTTPTSRPVTPSYPVARSSRPVTPSSRSTTPTRNNLRGAAYASEWTPRRSPSRGPRRSPYTVEGNKRYVNPRSSPSAPAKCNFVSPATTSKNTELFVDAEFFTRPSPSNSGISSPLRTETELFPIPLPSDNPVNTSTGTFFTVPSDDGFMFPVDSSLACNEPSSAPQLPMNGFFRRTHPTNDGWVENGFSDAHTTDQAQLPMVSFQHDSVGDHQKVPKLASVVTKHAALMARLKTLKESRMRRARTSDNATAPKNSIGKALAKAYNFRRGKSPVNGESNFNTNTPTPSWLEPPKSADQFMLRDADDDESLSSTKFGGHMFDAMLEVE